MIAK
jgi:hypothetical protein